MTMAASGQSLPNAACFENKIRVSALVLMGSQAKVGIVDNETRASHLVGVGESAGDIEVVSIDYRSDQVVLRHGEEFCTLSLAPDPDAPVFTTEEDDDVFYRGEAIENFLKEFPDAVEQGLIKFPMGVMPPAKGKGETIEQFLKDNPDLAKDNDTEAAGKGKGIEEFLKQHPEVNDEVQTEPGTLGPGIEELLHKNPIIITNKISEETP